jgi:NAD(P)-dependent dehydrogenase (short-subunit alcohol dehydrogenase family)
MDVKNKIVAVTGAPPGISLFAAGLLTERGAKRSLVSRSKDKTVAELWTAPPIVDGQLSNNI